jgi:GntR family transcriptional regulator
MLNSINPKSAVPIYMQIIGQIRRQVAAGLLTPGDQLPSVRDLASQLLINPNTAARVYRDLERDGLIETRRGHGTYVSPTAAAMAEPERQRIVSERFKELIDEARGLGLSDGAILNLCQKTLATHRPR